MSLNPPVDALITGKIRDPQAFLMVAALLHSLKEQGVFRRIVLSGWSDDLAEHAGLLAPLVEAGLEIVDNGPGLPVRSVGNYWEQVKTLEGGLSVIEDGAFVFKTRTDLLYYGGEATVAEIVAANLGQWCGELGFKHRIWIPSFVAMQPFFMADQCYFGLADDLRRFLRYDAQVEAKGVKVPLFPGSATHPAAASAEIRFWIQPFLDLFPALRGYQAVWPHSMNGYLHYQALQDYNLDSPIYQEYLALYWKALHTAFRVSEGRFCLVHEIASDGKITVRANAHSNNSPDFIEDALPARNHFPVSYSTDVGLRRFVETGGHDFYARVFCPALERAARYRYTPERAREYHDYLAGLERLAQQGL